MNIEERKNSAPRSQNNVKFLVFLWIREPCLYPYKNYHSQLDEKLKVHIYRTYLRPILTYAILVLQQISKTGFKTLERKQNKCLKMLRAIPWESRAFNKKVHQGAKLPTIREFANRHKLSFVHKFRISNNPVIKAITL